MIKVRLRFAYFAETENFLLKVLYQGKSFLFSNSHSLKEIIMIIKIYHIITIDITQIIYRHI